MKPVAAGGHVCPICLHEFHRRADDYKVMRFTFPDGEEQEHQVPLPLPRIVKLIQRREPPLEAMARGEFPSGSVVLFRLVHFADSTGRTWAEYRVDGVER